MTSAAIARSTVSLPLNSLVCDEDLQVRRTGLDRRVVERYRVIVRNADKGGQPLPAITVAVMKGMYVVVDGFHRHKAHELEKRTHIEAELVPVSSRAEALWLAAAGNLNHGKPLSQADKKAALSRFLSAKMHLRAPRNVSRQLKQQRPAPDVMSLREIANALGLSKSTTRLWMMTHHKKRYDDLYARVDTLPRNDGDELTPYLGYQGETAPLIARNALINAGAAVENLTGDDLSAFIGGLADLLRRTLECHGADTIQTALGAGWQKQWQFEPPPPEEDF